MASYRRSIFLVNRSFQLRFSLYVCAWLFALSFIYPLVVKSLFDYFIRYAALDPSGPPLEAIQHTRNDVLMLLVLFQLIFLGITFMMSLFMSHRIAGPLYKLRTFFEEAAKGVYRPELSFREKDHFHELAQDYNEM